MLARVAALMDRVEGEGGPLFAARMARLLRADVTSPETHYESICALGETVLEKRLLHEASAVYNDFTCMQLERSERVREIWERSLAYELEQLVFVADLMRSIEKRDPFEILPTELPEPMRYESHREFIRETLKRDVNFNASAGNGNEVNGVRAAYIAHGAGFGWPLLIDEAGEEQSTHSQVSIH
jgi:hypothetical protein